MTVKHLGAIWAPNCINNMFYGVTIHVTSPVLAGISRIFAFKKCLTAGGAFSRIYFSLLNFVIAAIFLISFDDEMSIFKLSRDISFKMVE
jgi:hypothetical protein